MSEFLTIIRERGFVHQCTDEAGLAVALERFNSGYIGFDCTAPSFHVGTLLPLMMLRWFQKCGHRPIVLMGGGTTLIGDPSGKDAARRILSPVEIYENQRSLERTFARFLGVHQGSPNSPMLINNAAWLTPLRFIDFLREVGPHFSVNRMLAMDSVRGRIERQQEMSLLEFNYMVLQSYDFVHLAREASCVLQMGGSDQWGNICNGIDLGRRLGVTPMFGLICPLIQTASGEKMGKTARGAVWLDPNLTSPYEFWQFWRNTDDRDVERFFKLFTDLSLEDIDRRIRTETTNDNKKLLATLVTEIVHGDVFTDFEHDQITPKAPTRRFSISKMRPNPTLADVCVAVGMFGSLTQARKNGYTQPLVAGQYHELAQRKILVEIVE